MSTESFVDVNPPLAYAIPEARQGPRVWGAAVIIFAGLALIVLGGCFMIGVLILTSQVGMTWHPRTYVLLGTLYVLAGACFIGAIALIISGLKNLFRLIHGG